MTLSILLILTRSLLPSPISLYVLAITAAESRAVRASERGIDQRTPSRPRKRGRSRAKPTPKTISRTIESIVDEAALPIAWRKMNAALFTQAKTTVQR